MGVVSQLFKAFSIEEKSHTQSGLQGQKGVHRIKVCCKQWDRVRDISSIVDFIIFIWMAEMSVGWVGVGGIEHIILYMVGQEVMWERTFFVYTHIGNILSTGPWWRIWD